jgi:hypothetical protein
VALTGRQRAPGAAGFTRLSAAAVQVRNLQLLAEGEPPVFPDQDAQVEVGRVDEAQLAGSVVEDELVRSGLVRFWLEEQLPFPVGASPRRTPEGIGVEAGLTTAGWS